VAQPFRDPVKDLFQAQPAEIHGPGGGWWISQSGIRHRLVQNPERLWKAFNPNPIGSDTLCRKLDSTQEWRTLCRKALAQLPSPPEDNDERERRTPRDRHDNPAFTGSPEGRPTHPLAKGECDPPHPRCLPLRGLPQGVHFLKRSGLPKGGNLSSACRFQLDRPRIQRLYPSHVLPGSTTPETAWNRPRR